MPPYFDISDLNASCHSLDLQNSVKQAIPLDSFFKQNRCVRFSPFDEVMEVLHVNDMSDEEISQVWYSSKEMQAIRRKCRRTVDLMNRCETLTSRGLEKHTEQILRQRSEIKSEIYEILLDTQHLQRLRGVVDPEQIAGLYKPYSDIAHLEAHMIGLSDAETIKVGSKNARESGRVMREIMGLGFR